MRLRIAGPGHEANGQLMGEDGVQEQCSVRLLGSDIRIQVLVGVAWEVEDLQLHLMN